MLPGQIRSVVKLGERFSDVGTNTKRPQPKKNHDRNDHKQQPPKPRKLNIKKMLFPYENLVFGPCTATREGPTNEGK